jgi:hypothetical protein
MILRVMLVADVTGEIAEMRLCLLVILHSVLCDTTNVTRQAENVIRTDVIPDVCDWSSAVRLDRMAGKHLK